MRTSKSKGVAFEFSLNKYQILDFTAYFGILWHFHIMVHFFLSEFLLPVKNFQTIKKILQYPAVNIIYFLKNNDSFLITGFLILCWFINIYCCLKWQPWVYFNYMGTILMQISVIEHICKNAVKMTYRIITKSISHLVAR